MSVRARECCAPDERLQALRRMLDDYRRRGRGGGSRRVVPTGVAELDRRLPHGGLPSGAVTEIISPVEGAGATTLTMRTALAALSPASNAGACGIVGGDDSRTVVVVDARGDLYPPAIWAMGIPPDRLLVVRAGRPADACWAVDQCLRCSAVGAVVAWGAVVGAAVPPPQALTIRLTIASVTSSFESRRFISNSS